VIIALARFKKIVLSSIIGNFKTHNNQRIRIVKWLERENEENVARMRNCCGWPSSPRRRVSIKIGTKWRLLVLQTSEIF